MTNSRRTLLPFSKGNKCFLGLFGINITSDVFKFKRMSPAAKQQMILSEFGIITYMVAFVSLSY